jgi:hypothetical protein
LTSIPVPLVFQEVQTAGCGVPVGHPSEQKTASKIQDRRANTLLEGAFSRVGGGTRAATLQLYPLLPILPKKSGSFLQIDPRDNIACMEIGSSECTAVDLSGEAPPALDTCAKLEATEESTSVTSARLNGEERICHEDAPDRSPSSIPNYGVESPSSGNAGRIVREEPSDEHVLRFVDAELVNESETEGRIAYENIDSPGIFGSSYVDDGHLADAEAAVSVQQIGRPSRNKKFNTDARHLAVFDVISSLLDLAGGADVQKKFLADVRLLSELTSFLERPANSRLIFTWGHLSESDVSGRSAEPNKGSKQKKAAGVLPNANGSRHAELDVSDSWMIYKEEVPGFLGSFLFFLRIFSIFGVTEPTDPSQFITLSAIEKGAKAIEAALGYTLDLSQFANSRSVGFGSSQKVHYVAMDTFCNWTVGLGLADELNSVWRQQLLDSKSPSASPSRKATQAGRHATAENVTHNVLNGHAFESERSSEEAYRNAEERMLQIASNRAQCLASWNELQEFSGSSSGAVEIADVDRWIVLLFPMLDFAHALRRAFRRIQQLRRQHKDLKQKEQLGSKSSNLPISDNSVMSKEFSSMLALVVYYRRMYVV